MKDDECAVHSDAKCEICPRYEIMWETERGIKAFEIWVGQDGGASWGPAGFEDLILIKYIKGKE
jgi:hypothetical protein